MYYKEETLFEQYPLELTDTYKGRGAVFAMTDIGRVYLKEYSGSVVKAEFLAKLLECVNEQGIHTETVVRTTEGECLAKDPDGVSYLLRKWCEGRECNTASWDEILRSADILASLHGAMNQMEHPLTEVLDTDAGRLLRTYEKHTRELRTVRNYTRGRKNKSEFEKEFLGLYPKFEEQASEILESLREQEGKKEGMGICHGDFNQHNVVFRSEYAAVISFDNICYDVQIGDLARFMRKILEKHNWNTGLGMDMIRAYDKKKKLSAMECEQICFRLAYPEKFWKVANHYYNSRKSWVSGRDIEKLDKVTGQEKERQQFLEMLFHFVR